MRVEAGDQDARARQPVPVPEICVQDAQRALEQILRDRRRHFLQWQVGRRQRNTQRAVPGAAGEHHDDERRSRSFGQVFGMAGEVHPSLIDDALVHRRRDHRRKLARTTAGQSAVEQCQHVLRIRRVEPAGHRRLGNGNVENVETACGRPGFPGENRAGRPSGRWLQHARAAVRGRRE